MPPNRGKCTPLASTVIPAPSRAPIRDGSCNNCARLPLVEASQPMTASEGSGSTWALSEVSSKVIPPVFPGSSTWSDGIIRVQRRQWCIDGCPLKSQTEQAIDVLGARIQLACGLGIGIDDAGGRADALQPDRLPHQHHLIVGVARRFG